MGTREIDTVIAMGDTEKANDTEKNVQGINRGQEEVAHKEDDIHGSVAPAEAAAAEDSQTSWKRRMSSFTEEVKRVGYLAGPIVAVSFSQYALQVVALMMVGHLGELALSSTAIAVTLFGSTGICIFLGMAGALETLCGQAYGAEQFHVLGTQTQTAIFCLNFCCLPLCLLWLNVEKLLIVTGQDPSISHAAGKFVKLLIPSFFASATLQPLIRFFQMQSLVGPLLVSSIGTLLFHIPICWILVFKSGLGNLGAALAMNISYWVNVVFLMLYIKFLSVCKTTWVPISTKVFSGVGHFLRLAVPSALMVCLGWWSFELMVLLSGLLPNPKLETSVLSVCLSIIGTLFTIPSGLGAAGSTRVSNELGARNPRAAQLAVYATMIISIAEASIVSTSLFVGRHVLGHIFSNDKEVRDYVTRMVPLVCLSVILDSFQGALSGIARGCGWQNIGAFVNFGAYYFCGIPIALILSFKVKMKGMGLWIGIQSGAFVQTLLLTIITICINWERQARKARERIFEGSSSADSGLS
ncbi:protein DETOXIFICATION 12-like [Punica granatum]|uniref:Protein DETOXIFICATION n=1 Tax=Punica granatum TaxID=22663 RepID=A0A6P8E546_PUNGR|nr:protein DETOXIFICATION 12-like [Punica granatum]